MAQNFLFMFEFVVDDIVVAKPNKCAPDEYPTCCEVSFRNSVFVSICDREFNQCIDPCQPKCGKTCLFSLESPITDDDKLYIHIYKKKTNQCKFLLGRTDLPIKDVFDKVMVNFENENPKWKSTIDRHIKALPNPKEQEQAVIVDNSCYSSEEDRREQLCPVYEFKKQLLPIFNLKHSQTGNVVLLIRLVAIGPNIVSSFPFAPICNTSSQKKLKNCDSRLNGSNRKSCDVTEPQNPNVDCSMQNVLGVNCNNNSSGKYKSNTGCMALSDPCHKDVKQTVAQRYFACNADKGCPFDVIEDECARAVKCNEKKPKKNCQPQEPSNSYSCDECIDECETAEEPCHHSPCDAFKCDPCSADTCDDCVQDPCSPCGQCLLPCFQTPRQLNPGPEAYDEFEACLNGSGLVIRVLKDTHQVSNVYDGTEDFNNDNVSECNRYSGKERDNETECSISDVLQRSNFARNHIKRQTGGHIINHPNLPKIRANIKYSGNDNCYTEKFQVPYSKIKTYCENQTNKINNYRRHRARGFRNSDNFYQPKHRKDEKNCCIQVDQNDIKNIMKGLDVDTRKKGIEVCYKSCEETDSDVFLVKLGSKHRSQHKKNNIEIELKTPKLPVVFSKQHVTTETQITETELDAALSNVCNTKKGLKGRKKKKT